MPVNLVTLTSNTTLVFVDDGNQEGKKAKVTIAIPSGAAAGDVLVTAFHYSSISRTCTVQDDFTVLHNGGSAWSGGSFPTLIIAMKVLTEAPAAGEVVTYTSTNNTIGSCRGHVTLLRGVDGSSVTEQDGNSIEVTQHSLVLAHVSSESFGYPEPWTAQFELPASYALALAYRTSGAGTITLTSSGATPDDNVEHMMAFPVAASEDRISSSVSEDAGSIFQAAQALAIDANVSEVYPWGTDISGGDEVAFVEALRPDEVALAYRAIPTRSQDLLLPVTGETIMSRLARTFPARLMTRVEDIAGEADDTMTAQEAMQHVFDAWAAEFDWFVAEDVPDLRLLLPGAIGNERQYYIDNATDGILTTQAIAIPQEATGAEDHRQSMRDIIDEWLAIYPGTIVRQNSSGKVEIVPRVGPDAPSDTLELTWRDLVSISEGEGDPKGIVNRARVVSQGWAYEENQELLPESFLVFTTGEGLERSVLVSEDVLPDTEEVQPYALAAFEGLVQTGTSVTVSVTVTAYGSSQQDSSSSFDTLGTNTESVTLEVEESADVGVAFFARLMPVAFLVTITNDGDGIRISPSTGANAGIPGRVFNAFGSTYMAFVVSVTSVTGTGWAKGAERVIGTFGFADSDSLPATDGGDALSDSVDLWGEREATITSSQFQLTPEQAQLVARAHVLYNINPRTIRDVQQSEWDKYPVTFDHIGRLVDLPNGETAVVESRSYSDAFSPTGSAMASAFSAAVTDTSGLDTSTDWLLLDSGDYLQLDDGSLVEPS